MEAKKTKTGKWTCCAYYKDADGIIRRPRFTSDRKKDAERMAEACSLEHKDDYILAKRGKLPITFADAGKNYIKNRENVLSPSTLVGYQNMLNRAYEMIAGQNIYDLAQEQIQSLVNLWTANGCSPKTVRNQHGFLAAVLTAYRPDFILHTHLPRAIRKDLYTPTDQDVKKLLAAIKDTRMEIPVLLAATGSLRRSEICALDAADIGDGFVRVNKALVWSPSKEWVLKTTKTEAEAQQWASEHLDADEYDAIFGADELESTSITAILPEDLLAKLDETKTARRCSRSEIIIKALRAYLAKE